LCIGAAVILLLYIFIPLQVVVQLVVGQTHRTQNPCIKAMVYSCTCCIKCTQEIVSYVNKGAIIEMVLRGDFDFFTSAGSSMRVMRDAELSVISLHGVTMVFQIVGIVISGGLGGFLAYWFLGGLLYTRWVAGGFSVYSRTILQITAAAGVVFGPLGYVGASSSNGPLLRYFSVFNIFRLVAICSIFAVDMTVLRHCESYLGSFAANFHYDFILDSTAKEGNCYWTRVIFLFSFHADLLLSLYATTHALMLTRRVEGPFNWTVNLMV